MKTKLLLAAAVAAISLGTGVAQADTKSDAVTEAKFGLYINVNPYGYYYRPYYYQPYYYGPTCFYNSWGQYVCKYY
jgi:hypothetical protein